jgi:hypothetical protein
MAPAALPPEQPLDRRPGHRCLPLTRFTQVPHSFIPKPDLSRFELPVIPIYESTCYLRRGKALG